MSEEINQVEEKKPGFQAELNTAEARAAVEAIQLQKSKPVSELHDNAFITVRQARELVNQAMQETIDMLKKYYGG